MKKWLIIGLLVAVLIGVGVWYFRKEKKKPTDTPPDTASNNTGGASSGSASGSASGSNVPIQPDAPLKSANRATILQLQKELNALTGSFKKSMPIEGAFKTNTVKEDGKWGNETKAAVQWCYAVGQLLTSKVATDPKTKDFVGDVTLNQVRFLINSYKTNLDKLSKPA